MCQGSDTGKGEAAAAIHEEEEEEEDEEEEEEVGEDVEDNEVRVGKANRGFAHSREKKKVAVMKAIGSEGWKTFTGRKTLKTHRMRC